ncbi:MAG: class I SAM-dependent methyltransferase [Bacteroidales bacterium]|nr:class I SAM-dependent methyltransferase [Bacteroidales bacterium]
MFTLIENQIEEYCEAHTTPETDLLYRLNRETHLKVMNPRMLSGQLQGSFLTFVSKMIKPKHILEIGTYTGYSTLCLAEGLSEDGIIDTIEIDVELEDIIRKYFLQSPLNEKINLIIGDALKLVPEISIDYDLIFIDAEKRHYTDYYKMLLPKVKKGGIMLVDNVLWNEKVVEEVNDKDFDTKEIMEFNDMVQRDNSVRNLLLPFRDGIMMIEKL